MLFILTFIYVFSLHQNIKIYASNNTYIKDIDISKVRTNNNGIKYIGNQLIIKIYNNYTESDLKNLINLFNGKVVGKISAINEYQVEFNYNIEQEKLNQIYNYLKNHKLVKHVYFNLVIERNINLSANNNMETHLNNNKIDWWIKNVNADKIWKYNLLMNNVNVGIIDNMFDIEHEDLKFEKVFNNPKDITDSHGTHVAGIIGGIHNNIGIDGISTNSKLYGFSLYGENSSSEKIENNNVQQIMLWKYAIAELLENGVKIINVSLGNDDEFQFALLENDKKAIESNNEFIQQIEEFLKEFLENGYDFIIVQAAGNTSLKSYVKDETTLYGYRYATINDTVENIKYTNWLDTKYNGIFANIHDKELKDRIIVVSAVSKPILGQNHILMCSQIGNRVDVLAPGGFINSCFINNNYGRLSGTSMAAPFISATASMIWGINSNLTGKEIKEIIINTADTSIKLGGNEYKILNVENAVQKTLDLDLN